MNKDIEFQITAIFLDGSKRVLVNESNQAIMEKIPNSRLRVNRFDSAPVMSSAEGIIIVLGGLSSIITIGQAIYSSFKKLLSTQKWNSKPELIIQINDGKGGLVHIVINEEIGTEDEFILTLQNEVEIKIFNGKDENSSK